MFKMHALHMKRGRNLKTKKFKENKLHDSFSLAQFANKALNLCLWL